MSNNWRAGLSGRCWAWATIIAALCGGPLRAAEEIVITEFMAANSATLKDQDGDFSDWIELCNLGASAVNLAGWSLTDSAANLTKWRFPSTNLAPGQFLVVFASGKNRRTPGGELHTSFKLDAPGEYLALVRPDDVTRASEFAPAFPPQAPDLSYGVPLQQSWATLIGSNSPVRVLVPTDGALGDSWIQPDFNDATWRLATNGVGFEQDVFAPFTPTLLADSVADFSGVQGFRQWSYGYWDRKNDGDGVYDALNEFTPFPNAAGPFSAGNFWDGSAWNWFNGDPPWTTLTSTGGHPTADNGNPDLPSHWVIRRYQCPTNGPLRITGTVSHSGGWVYATATGTAPSSTLYIYLTGVGEGYLDDLKLVAGSVAEAGPNLLANSSFDSNLTGWTVSANLTGSAIVPSPSHSGGAVRLVSSAAGSSRSTSIYQDISPALVTNDTYTLSYWYLPASNSAPLVIRLSGSGLSSTPSACGDGVIARIFVDGTQVYQQSALLQSFNYSLQTPAHAGSVIDFALDPGSANNDQCDAAIFTARVQTDDPTVSLVADSVADWSLTGTQGENNWTYGYYNRTLSPGYLASKFTPFPHLAGPVGPSNYWTGTGWDWANGNPPWTEVGQTVMHPNGVNNGQEHWAIRRYVSEVSGRLTVEWSLAKAGTCGGGVTGRFLHNGVEKDSAAIAAADTVGVTRTVTLSNVLAGDILDFALDPNGPGGSDDSCDSSILTARVRAFVSLAPLVKTDLAAAMRHVNASAYLRLPVVIADPTALRFLKLRLRSDDGFVAFLNGVGVAARNSPLFPDVVQWNSSALEPRPDAEAAQFDTFDLSAYQGLLRAGANLLAIQGLNASAADPDFLIEAELTAATVNLDLTAPRYFTQPTPGTVNGYGYTNLGPLLAEAAHTPALPRDSDDLVVRVRVTPTFQPVASVKLTYRVMYNAEVTVPMFDDGQHGDGATNDGWWAAAIPASASTPGQMIRYYVTAADTRTNSTREPAFTDPLDSPQYLGTIVSVPTLEANPLPVIHWFIDPAQMAAADTEVGTRCAMFYNGDFYDNIAINIHGQSSRGFPKKSYDFNFNRGAHFQYATNQSRVDAINFISTYADKAHLRNVLAYDTYAAAGAPYHWCYPVRVQQNGAFWGTTHLMENGDNNWLDRLGLDSQGALYKMYNVFSSLTDCTIGVNGSYAEKKTRKNEGNADLVALFNGVVAQSGDPRIRYLYDNTDVAEMINFLAARIITGDVDCCHKNYYLYRDSDGTGLWQAMPWDVDLSFGRVWSCTTPCLSYWDQILHSDTGLYIGSNNGLFGAILNTTAMRQMYLRRVRTLMDEVLQPPGTPANLRRYESRVDQLAVVLTPDAALDLAKWGTWGNGAASSSCCVQTLAQALADLKTNYFVNRRAYIFTNLTVLGGGAIPLAQPADATVRIAGLDYNPATRNQAHEFLCLTNPNAYAVDLSGWTLTGGIQFTFRGGTVIPANGTLYLTPDLRAFRTRPTFPTAGVGLFVQGNYQGQLSAWGETLVLSDQTGRAVLTNQYAGTPSLPQQFLRITEIMFHPAPPPHGIPLEAEDFEYLELKNISPTVTLDLSGVHFTNGLDFAFPAGPLNLAPGEAGVLVRNRAAFVARYGTGPRILGEYAGALDNGGERLRLDDVFGEKILEFSYDPQWHPLTDGRGFSLVIVDENAPWSTWDLPASWQQSSRDNGSPGAAELPPVTSPAVVIHEVLSASVAPVVDAVELHNPTSSPADISGWFLTDDFNAPQKFRIPTNTVIAPGGFVAFTELDFNVLPGLDTSFAFNSKGDEAYLFAADSAQRLTGYYHGFEFGAAETNVSFGTYVTSVGETHFVAQSTNTFGAPNALPKTGPVVIREIMYHPATNGLEYVALQNISAEPVPLFDPAHPTLTWQFSGLATDLPTGLTLQPGASLYLAGAGPEVFRSTYLLPANSLVVGPMTGALQDNGENLQLSRPGPAEIVNGQPVASSILVDAVRYSNLPPWPTNADGSGASLRRLVLSAYGNDPTNWEAGTVLRLPVITQQPLSTNLAPGSTVTFRVVATGSNALSYQWRYNGTDLAGATNSTVTLANLQTSNAGPYTVVVRDAVGPVESQPAILIVLVKPIPFLHPQPVIAAVGETAVFTSAASGTLPMGARWRRNSGSFRDYVTLASNLATLSLPDLFLTNSGNYSAVFTNYAAPTPALQQASSNGPLTVVLPPASQVLETGASVTLNALVNGPLPRYFAWEYNGAALLRGTNAASTLTSTNSLLLPAFQPAQAGAYSFLLTNIALYTVTNIVGSSNVITTNWAPVGLPAAYTAYLSLNTPLEPPAILLPPTNLVVAPGSNALFIVTATGTAPLAYQWLFNATNPLAGQTNAWFVLSNVQPPQVGSYRVIVTNPAGLATSPDARLLLTTTDSDGDHLPDWAELLAGTDPAAASSYLRVDEITSGGGAVSLRFMAVSNRTYSLLYRLGVNSGSWGVLTNVPAASTTREVQVSDPDGSAAQRFYRLATPQLP